MGIIKDYANRYLWYLFFIPLPIALLIVSQWQMSTRGPYFERLNYDPEYAYLLNGLKLADGQSPDHIDHPGTTLQILTSVVINFRHAIKNILVERTPRSDDVLQHPEEYLLTIRNLMAIGIGILYFLLAIQVYKKTKLIWAGIAFQLFPFLSTSLISALSRVSVEPFLIITILLVTILLIDVTEKKQQVYPIWQLSIMGLLLGTGMVTKLTFVPFILLVSWFPSLRDRNLVRITFIATIFTLIIPIWSQANFNNFVRWVIGLVTKQGVYGSGSAGLFPPYKTFVLRIFDLAQVEPYYFIILGILIIWFIISLKNRTPENQLERSRGSISIGILVIQLILVMKFPSPHYLVPGLTWLGFIYIMGILKLESMFPIRSIKFKVIQATLLVLLIGSAVANTFTIFSLTRSIEKVHLETIKIDAFIKAKYPNCSIIPYHGASDQRYVLEIGNNYAGRYFSEILTNLYPNTISYNIWGRYFTTFKVENKDVEIQNRLTRGECILLRGGNLDGALDLTSPYYNAQLDLDKIIVETNERVYRLRAFRPKTQQ